MKHTHQSVLRAILDDVYTAKTLEAGLAIVEKLLVDSPVREEEKRLMILHAKGCQTLVKLQTYITNSFLKYEGMGVKHRNEF